MHKIWLIASLASLAASIPLGIVTFRTYEIVATQDPRLEHPKQMDVVDDLGGAVVRTAPNGTKVIEMRGYELANANLLSENGKKLDLRTVKPPREVHFSRVSGSDHSGAVDEQGSVKYRLSRPSELPGVLADNGIQVESAVAEPERLGAVSIFLDDSRKLTAFSVTPPEFFETIGGQPIASWGAELEESGGVVTFQSGLGLSEWLALSLINEDGSFSLRPEGDGRTGFYSARDSLAAQKVDELEMSNDGSEQEREAVQESKRRLVASTKCGSSRSNIDWPVIKVLPVITQRAKSSFGDADLTGLLKDQEQYINLALQSSDLEYRVVIGSPKELSLSDVGVASDAELVTQLVEAKWDFDLMRRNPTRAVEVANKRRAYEKLKDMRDEAEADLALVFVADGVGPRVNPADRLEFGWASAIPADRNRFYALIGANRSQLEDGKTASHELGHLLGGHHDMQSSSGTVPPISHGFRFTLPSDAIPRGTLMAVGVKRAPRFSGPGTQPCEGQVLGMANVADEVSVLRVTLPIVADLFENKSELRAARPDAQVCRTLRSDVALEGSACDGSCKESIYPFDPRSSILSNGAHETIKRFVSTVREELRDQALISGGAAIVVAGYADSVGDEGYNMGLSYRRAVESLKYMHDLLGPGHGLPMFACAYGEDRPLKEEGSTDDSTGASNRRVELHVIGVQLEDLPTNLSVLQSASTAQSLR